MFLKNIEMASFYGKRIFLSQNSFLKIPRRNGFLILVPEIGDDLPGKYPLLKKDKSPEFSNITIEKCVAAIGRQALEFEEAVKTLEKQIKNVENICPKILFKDVLNPLEELYTSLNTTWGIAKTLYVGNQSLIPTQYYISINDRSRKACAAKFVSTPIYQACKNVMNNKESELNDEQKRVLTKFILEGKLNGMDLSEKKKLQFSDLHILLFRNLSKYSQKVEVAANMFTFTIRDPKIVEDFPKELLKSMAQDPSSFHVGPWIVTLYSDVMHLFMEYCPDRALRWKVWQADVTKASVLHDRAVETSTTLEGIRQQRNQAANLLGYKTFADLSMETKMAGSVENIYHTFNNLLATARPAQEYEIKEIYAFASERGLQGPLQHWDIAYWGRQRLRAVYKYREDDINNYFPLPKVLCGLFELIEMLFDVKIIESKKSDIWHKDVRFFDIFDLKRSSTDPISHFYLDLYARSKEKFRLTHDLAYMIPIQNRSKISGTKPLAALIFNFTPPLGANPSLLSFKDLQALFQKFGHMLQHTLTTVEYADIAGFSFMEWDTMFISDYFLQNWLYEPSFLQEISCHQDTGEVIPLEMIEKLKHLKIHLAGYYLCKELYLSHFDLELYSSKDFWNNIMGRLWDKYFVLPAYKKDSHICSFKEIFSGDWAAAYYSNIWSRMIAADLYSAFQDVPDKNKEQLKELGSRYRETFLSTGGTYSAREVFRKFRGRDPSPKALLKNLELDVKCSMLNTANENNLLNSQI
ncbi:Oligopeptidase A [Habropoda laboriosa]|uniref:oligopeptidase A n=1 Tax=Habropoda laboriosa TaxID=597456 RepID=A0A0L7QV64_9HYME|nr:PREDICTED: probable cytosolic oligopeptidase A [Habropoda laboriosa]KOC62525.1 Oligopeptidase A [Habropoda laboriosa]